ncbi:hypothetical protein [Glycomyces sp. NPDC048151]|uniref:hypothetical protein n=1 Tax=Glycomyces sp. NPDC048151 TaxID=3364002 RepID=UPI003714A6C9
MAGQQAEAIEGRAGAAPVVETAPPGTVLREFGLSGGRFFQIVRTEGDAVRVHRTHPRPEQGRDVAGATALDSDTPEWRWPANWGTDERFHARTSILNAWAAYRQAQRAAQETAEQEAAEREGRAA